MGISCWLRSTFNWFNKKVSHQIWRGDFKCIDSDCHMAFKANIRRCLDSYSLTITFTGKSNHPRLNRPERISGEERKLMQNEVVAKGVRNLVAENIIYNQSVEDNGRNSSFQFLINRIFFIHFIYILK